MKPLSPRLAITIPTFNRKEQLAKRIAELRGGLSQDVHLYIFDNCSSDKTLDLFENESSPYIFLRRSSANLGMAANISKCFTNVESEWIWMLGDDDRTAASCIDRALALISNGSADLINTVTNSCGNEANVVCCGIDELLEKKHITDLMHVSSNLYRLTAFRNSFQILAPSGITMAPHVAMIFHAAASGLLKVELSTETLLDEEPTVRRWSSLEVATGMAIMPRFFPASHRAYAAVDLHFATRWMILWGLMTITSRESAQEWKSTVRFVDASLSALGARLPNLLPMFAKQRKDVLRNLQIALLVLTPITVLLRVACWQRKRFESLQEQILPELI